jgi:hypothetical protein
MKLHDLPASRTLAALLFTSFAIVATAGGPDRDHKVTGTLACGGNHFMRFDGEQHTTTYSLRNYASEGEITIDSITIYDGNGTVVYAFPSDSTPDFPGPRQTLGPHGSTLFNTGSILAFDYFAQDPDPRPIQAIFEWSASKKAPDLELSGSATRLARNGEERSRSQGECNPLGRDGPWGLLGR